MASETPALRESMRPFQYSLRTLFVVMTAVAMSCAVVAIFGIDFAFNSIWVCGGLGLIALGGKGIRAVIRVQRTTAMKTSVGSLFSALLSLPLITYSGAILGGITRMAPCHRAPDFSSGAFFGASAFLFEFSPWAMLAGLVVGAFCGLLSEAS